MEIGKLTQLVPWIHQQQFHTLLTSQNKAGISTATAASKDLLVPPALPALCGERRVSAGITGTDSQVATRYESTFASVYILLKPFCQFSTRTGGGGRGYFVRFVVWFVFQFSFIELKRGFKHSLVSLPVCITML